MLVAQDPALDPRIDWSAKFASTEFDVTVIGLTQPGEVRPDIERKAGYVVRRYTSVASSGAIGRFAGFICSELSFSQRIGVFLVLPVLVSAFLGIRITRQLFGRDATPSNVLARLVKEHWPASLRARRLRSFLFSLYHHFGPVTSTLWHAVEELGEGPDIVHCNDLDTLLVGVKIKKKYGCPLVYDAHEYWPFSDPDFAGFEKSAYAFYERLLIRHADDVITVSSYLASRLASDYGLSNVTSIPNAVPLTDRSLSGRFAADLDGLAANRTKFLYQGGFAPHRGIEELLLAWKEVDCQRAALFLRGPDNQNKQRQYRLAENLGLLHRSVYFLTPVSEEDLVGAASAADIGIIPYRPTILNHVYSCPNKLSQYLQAGVMLLADSNLLYINQIVTESRAGILYDSNISGSLLCAIKTILNDPTLVRRCKANALAFSDNHFNWNNFFGGLRQIYLDHAKT